MNEAHERVAGIGAIKASIKKTVFAMKHGLFQRLFKKVVMQGSVLNAEK